ncbi:MAG TPA: hypothetical protein VM008_04045 [Phycisphaerae bacterium]|nr:hypothetical protein [Phycisphaerae bacterium]
MNTLPSNYSLSLQTTSPALRASATFPKEFPGFHGHFPGNPLLPGFMHIQLALDILAAANLPHTLKEIPTARFTRPIPPETEIQITLSPTTPNTYEATLNQNDDALSTFTLTIE